MTTYFGCGLVGHLKFGRLVIFSFRYFDMENMFQQSHRPNRHVWSDDQHWCGHVSGSKKKNISFSSAAHHSLLLGRRRGHFMRPDVWLVRHLHRLRASRISSHFAMGSASRSNLHSHKHLQYHPDIL